MNIGRILMRHKVAVLEFSGGKDSLACLYLMKPWWDKITVMWANTGDAFPETVEQMEKIRAMVPNFTAIWTGQPKQIEKAGYPADVLPFWDSPFGQEMYPNRTIKLQSPMECCAYNMWIPLNEAVMAMGATLVIRGQRLEEARRSPVRSGEVVNGIENLFPLEDWSRAKVMEFLNQNQVNIPRNYEFFDSSLDCQHCTAYLDANKGKFAYMEKYHPELNREVKRRLQYIHRAVETEMAHLRAIVE